MTTTTASTADLQITSSFEYQELLAGKPEETLFLANLQAPEYESEQQSQRAPIDLVCVIDRSGSMAGDKIDLVRKSLLFMIEQLKPNDRLALVGFDSSIYNDLNLTDLDEQGKKNATASVNKLVPGSCTNLSGGLFEGLSVLKQRQGKKNDVCSVLLFTDGLANEGLTDSNAIATGVEKAIQEMGIACTVFTFGFGADHNENMLKQISQVGGGMYFFIQKIDEIPECFASCLGGLMSVVAQNIKLKLQPCNGAKIDKVFTSYKQTVNGDVTELAIGDVYSNEQRDIIVRLQLPACTVGNHEVVKMSLSYFDVINTQLKSKEIVASLNRVETITTTAVPNKKLDMQRNRLICADAMKEAAELGDSGKKDLAKQKLQEAMEKIAKSPSGTEEYCKNLVDDLKNCLNTMSEDYNIASKKMKYMEEESRQQRQTKMESKSAGMYSNNVKSKMMSDAKTFFKK